MDDPEVQVIRKWIEKLDSLKIIPSSLPPSHSFVKYNMTSAVFTVTVIIRFTILALFIEDPKYTLCFGRVYHAIPGESIFNLNSAALTYLSLAIQSIYVFRVNIIYKLIANEFHPYLFDKNTALQGEDRIKFLKRMNTIFRMTSMAERMGTITAAAFVLNVTVLACMSETRVINMVIWFLWFAHHVYFTTFCLNNIYWVCGLWFALKHHITMQIDQLLQVTDKCLKLESNELILTLMCVVVKYKRLSKKIKAFNQFSKQLSFTMTTACTFICAGLLGSILINITVQPIIALVCITYWIMFEFGCLAFLSIASSVFKKSRRLYVLFNRVYARKVSGLNHHHLRVQALMMIKNTGSKTMCPLALVNIDDRIYNHQIMGRYITYSVKMISILLKFATKYVVK